MPSLLRLAGLAIGLLLVLAAVRGARGQGSRGSVILEVAGGVGLLAVMALVLTACSGGGDKKEGGTAPSPSPPTTRRRTCRPSWTRPRPPAPGCRRTCW